MNRIEARRKALGLRQRDVARALGMKQGQFSRYETGDREPGVYTAIRIADALGVTDVRELFTQGEEDEQ